MVAVTIQTPPTNNSNHPKATLLWQQQSRAISKGILSIVIQPRKKIPGAYGTKTFQMPVVKEEGQPPSPSEPPPPPGVRELRSV